MTDLDAIRLFGLASNFWQLTLNVSNELISSGNPDSMQYRGWGWPSKEEHKEYEELVKWSDLNIVEPILFNFYHGIELSLKALIRAKNTEIDNIHKLSKLLQKVTDLYIDSDFIDFYEKYVNLIGIHEILRNFCNESGITMDLYYQSLKYPVSTKGVEFNHTVLRYQGEDGVALFQEIYEDLSKVRKVVKQKIISECEEVLS
ncbi:HEPN domain-containing protein [Microbulbifer sp. VTAC004]|uniref:HEPN domain-containing protein n=1 Tax=Microbulbifer sp. VTAC004 TaxID=3243386 RepID=UPI00403A7C05